MVCINSQSSENLLLHNESDPAGSMINLIVVDFVWILPFIYIFTESHGIIFLVYMHVKNEDAWETQPRKGK